MDLSLREAVIAATLRLNRPTVDSPGGPECVQIPYSASLADLAALVVPRSRRRHRPL
jgi:hypothetical protein